MAQSAALIETLKRSLKANGLTYAMVANSLGLSEASVKRMFALKSFTLGRLEQICQLMDMEVTDLVREFEEGRHRITHLTHEQEQELVADIGLLLAVVCVRNRWSFEDIVQHYAISETECVRYLAKLDKLGLIDLLPKNQIRLRVTRDFRWIPHGPMERFFEEKVQKEFFKSSFDGDDKVRLFITGMLTHSSRQIVLRKLESLASEFAELQKEDAGRPVEGRKNVGLVLAMRPWELSGFKSLKRKA